MTLISTANRARSVIFVNRFYAPDLSATSQILSDVCEALAKQGLPLVVYTSRMSYDDSSKFPEKETLNGVHVRRVWSTRFGRSSTLGRAFDYATFYISVTSKLLFSVKRGDVLVAKTDPPVLSIPLGLVARFKRAKLVNWLQDVFPEVAQELGIGSSAGPLLGILKKLRNRSLMRARMNVAIGTRMAEKLLRFNVPAERICVIPNFADDEAIIRLEDHSLELRQEWGFKKSDFVVCYSGNLGRAHDFATIIETADSLKARPEIQFLFIGGGFHQSQVASSIEKRRLTNVHFRKYQPRSRLCETLALPDLHWASLAPSLEGYMVPSKVYGIAAAGRPLLMIGAGNGEVGQMLDDAMFGKCVLQGRSDEIRQYILDLRSNQLAKRTLGQNARKFIDEKASRKNAIIRWLELIDRLSEGDL